MTTFIDCAPILALCLGVGYFAGFAHGYSTKIKRAIAGAEESELIHEVKKRRIRARISSEVETQVEAEVKLP